MGTRDKRVDAYLAAAPEFALPILERCRELVHEGCPDVEETIKWSVPAFECGGLLCHMAAFKQHATFGFWKHALVVGEEADQRSMGSFGRLASVKDLPPKRRFLSLVKKATKLNADGVKGTREKGRAKAKPPAKLHPEFAAALKKNKAANATLDGFAPSFRREYLEWITEAKRDATREKRIVKAIEWLAEGKKRNWKYESC